MKKNLGAVDLLDEARDFETQKLQNIYGAGMKVLKDLVLFQMNSEFF